VSIYFKEKSMKVLRVIKSVMLPCLILGSVSVSAQWSLDNEASVLSFVTVKAEHIAEAHTFNSLSGSLGADGQLSVEVELASVDTLIPIRNERMREMLFEVDVFPVALLSAEVDVKELSSLEVGEWLDQEIPLTLALHGNTVGMDAAVRITQLDDGYSASLLTPLILSADNVGLVAGVEKLRQVAGLSSISRSVPVSFNVTFRDGNGE
jgi:hypothetical protein